MTILMNIDEVKNNHLDEDFRIFDKEVYINKLMMSVKKFGQMNPILINDKKEVIGGRYLFQAIQRLGYTTILCESIIDQSSPFLESIDEYVGLHERIHIIYVVNGFEASYCIQDGDKVLHRQRGNTIQEALNKLETVLKETEENNMNLVLSSLEDNIGFSKTQILKGFPEIMSRHLDKILNRLEVENKIKIIDRKVYATR